MEDSNNSIVDWAMNETISKIYSSHKLSKIEKLLNWDRVSKVLSKADYRINSRVGGVCYSALFMFKIMIIQTMYSFTDRQIEEELSANIVFKKFCNISFNSLIPDHSTIFRWRERFNQCNIFEEVFNESLEQIIDHGIDVTKTTIIDSTSIISKARPKRRKEIIDSETSISADDQDQPSSHISITKTDSNDPEASWGKNGQGYWLGYKTTSSCNKDGIFTAMLTTRANVYDGHQLKEIIDKLKLKKGGEVYADKGFSSKENSELLHSFGLIDKIMKKQKKKSALDKAITSFNKSVSQTRFVIERSFGNLKKNIGVRRSPYLGLRKTHNYVLMGGLVSNLIRCLTLL
jgi:IS5 family transposase